MKKLLSVILALSIATTTAITGCSKKEPAKDNQKTENSNLNLTGLPIVKEKVDFKFAAKTRWSKNFADLKFFKDLEAKTNVHINWTMTPDEGWKEKKSLLFAGGDLPDAFYGQAILDDIDVVKYGSQQMLIPLEGLIDKYAPNIKKLLERNNEYKKQLTAPDGHIYSLPNLEEDYPKIHDKVFINKKWLDQLGMPIPTTVDEFYNTLKAFKENDLNKNGKQDEIPFTFLYTKKENRLTSMFGPFGIIDPMDHIIVKNDKVLFSAAQPEFKEGINYFNKLFKENLVDKEAFTHDMKVYTSKLQSKEPIVGAYVGWSMSATVGPTNKDYVPLPPLKGKDGKQIWARYDANITSRNSFSITSSCKQPEVVMRWIDESFEPTTSFQIAQGLLDVTLKKNADGIYEYLPIPSGSTFNEMIHSASPGTNGISAVTTDVWSKVIPNVNIAERRELDKFYAPFGEKEIYPNVSHSAAEFEKMAEIQADLMSYVDQMYAKWMLNGGVDQEWDAYLKKLKDMKLDDLLKIKQDAYNRYKAAK